MTAPSDGPLTQIADDDSRTRAELKANLLAALVTASLDPIVSESTLGIITSWNPSAEQLYGWSAAEAIGRPGDFVTVPELAHERQQALERLALGKRVARVDSVRLHRDGHRIDVAVSTSPVYDADGQLTGTVRIERDITDEKRWESERVAQTDALSTSESQQSALAESIPQLVWIASATGQVVYFNARWTEYSGLDLHELKLGTGSNLLHPGDFAGMTQIWGRCVAEGRAFETKYRLRRRDGEYRWHIARAVPVSERGGRITRWFGTCTDIHDHHVAEESLARDTFLLANVRDSVIVTDLDGIVTYWNEAATKQYGWTTAEMMGRPVTDRFPAEALGDEKAKQTIADGEDFWGEFLDYRKDGSRFWIDAHLTHLRDRAGRHVGMMGVSHDITARREAEHALRLRDRAIQALSQGIVITDANHVGNPIIYASPGFERMTGYRAAEVSGKNCRLLQGKDSDPAVIARLHDAVLAGEPITEQIINYRKDGSAFWNELSISPVMDESGALTHFIGVVSDVTARRALEVQYRHSQKMEAFGQLAGGVAHDFNNLLTVINGYADMVLSDLPPGHGSREMLELIRKAGARSAGLTRQLLAFSRQQVIAPQVLSLNETVGSLERMLRRIIGEDIVLSTVLDPELGTTRLDPGQLEQVIMNLAVNARDAMPGGGTLTFETRNVTLDADYCATHPDTRPGAYLLLAVTDTGTGMARATCDKIFEPFFTTKPVGQGTGLGLSVVHGIAVQNGGHVTVDSELGSGTTFKLYWPRLNEAVPVRRVASGFLRGPTGSETLLLVEDDPEVRALGRHVLAGCGYRVLEASDGKEALKLAAECGASIETLITDVVMPGMGGRELAEKLTAMYPRIKVLYVSGYTNDAIVRHGIQHDQINFLQKPFSPLALTRKVREILDGGGIAVV